MKMLRKQIKLNSGKNHEVGILLVPLFKLDV